MEEELQYIEVDVRATPPPSPTEEEDFHFAYQMNIFPPKTLQEFLEEQKKAEKPELPPP